MQLLKNVYFNMLCMSLYLIQVSVCFNKTHRNLNKMETGTVIKTCLHKTFMQTCFDHCAKKCWYNSEQYSVTEKHVDPLSY